MVPLREGARRFAWHRCWKGKWRNPPLRVEAGTVPASGAFKLRPPSKTLAPGGVLPRQIEALEVVRFR